MVSDAEREAWTWTVLATAESSPNRRAFIDGYNGNVCDKPATSRKLQWHHRGELVRRHLERGPA